MRPTPPANRKRSTRRGFARWAALTAAAGCCGIAAAILPGGAAESPQGMDVAPACPRPSDWWWSAAEKAPAEDRDEEGPCPADFDGSGRVDAMDLAAFQAALAAGEAAADVDHSTGEGVLDVFDLLRFQEMFRDGCP